MNDMSDENIARKAWLGVLSKSPAADLAELWQRLDLAPKHTVLRAPEVGGVMVRGRAGAVGAPFNLGEMTVTRASIALDCGTVGHGYVQGRDRSQALQAAQVDALMQTDAVAQVDAGIIAPLKEAMRARKAARSVKAATTKVDFFTMVRGED